MGLVGGVAWAAGAAGHRDLYLPATSGGVGIWLADPRSGDQTARQDTDGQAIAVFHDAPLPAAPPDPNPINCPLANPVMVKLHGSLPASQDPPTVARQTFLPGDLGVSQIRRQRTSWSVPSALSPRWCPLSAWQETKMSATEASRMN